MEKTALREHTLSLMNREVMALSGVTEVTEFSSSRVILKTTMGNLTIKGKELSISQLNTQSGTLDVSGQIQTIQYAGKSKDGLLTGLFK